MSRIETEKAKSKSRRKKLALSKETLKDLTTNDGRGKDVRGGANTLRRCP